MNKKVIAAIRDTRYASMDDVEAALVELGEVTKADVQRGLDALLEPTTLPSESYKLACSFFVGVVKACPDRALFAPLCKALTRAAHPATREALIHALPLVNNVAEHASLIGLFRHSDDKVRAGALRVLEKVAVSQTFDALVAEMKSGSFHPHAQQMMVAVVEKLGPRAVPALAAATAHSDVRMVCAAFEAAARLRDAVHDRAPFVSAARARLRDPDDDIGAAAATCFAALAASEDEFLDGVTPVVEGGGPRAVAAALRGVIRFPTLRALALLEQRLMRGPSRVSIVALDVLLEIGSDDVLSPLVAAIAHRRQRVRTEAVRVLKALAAQGRIDMARAILYLLRSRDANVRRMASEVLQAMSQRGAAIWPRLVAFIRDEDWWVRERLADALVPMAGAELIPHLVPLLDDALSNMRRFAVQTLGRIGDGKALAPLLVRARDDGDWLVREEAVRAIGHIGDERAVPYVVKLLEGQGLEIACLDSLRKLKRDDARGLLAELLVRPERDVRMAALRYAATVEASEHIEVVAGLLADADPDIARSAASTLRAWHYGGASDPALDEAGRVLAELLRKVVKSDASDLILVAGRPAFMKCQGRVERLTKTDLTAENIYELLAPLLLPEHVEALAMKLDVDFSHENRRVGARFRVNAFQSEDGLGAVFRVIKGDVVPLEKLGVPAIVAGLAEMESGLVLFGGPPGSGKSTTLAGIIHKISQTQSRHIISIEDPIEGVHASAQSLITQREIGVHTVGYQSALRAALREDPDVILVGELRDLETISFAVTAAETGHLVFGTVHAVAADSCVERVINAFPPDRQAQIRTMLSDTLKAIVCQHLIPRRDGGRALACEVMINTESVANLIRKGAAHQIASQMVLQREHGMCLMDDSIAALVDKKIIDVSEAYLKARDKSRFPIGDHVPVGTEVALASPAAAPPPPSPPRAAPPPVAPPRASPPAARPAALPVAVGVTVAPSVSAAARAASLPRTPTPLMRPAPPRPKPPPPASPPASSMADAWGVADDDYAEGDSGAFASPAVVGTPVVEGTPSMRPAMALGSRAVTTAKPVPGVGGAAGVKRAQPQAEPQAQAAEASQASAASQTSQAHAETVRRPAVGAIDATMALPTMPDGDDDEALFDGDTTRVPTIPMDDGGDGGGRSDDDGGA